MIAKETRLEIELHLTRNFEILTEEPSLSMPTDALGEGKASSEYIYDFTEMPRVKNVWLCPLALLPYSQLP